MCAFIFNPSNIKCPKVACNATWMCIKLGHKVRKPLLVRIQPQLLCIWYIWHAWAVVIWCWISRELGLRFISLGLHLYVSQLYLTYVMCGENWRAPRGMLCNVIFSHELVQSVRYWCENNFCLRVYATFAYKIWIKITSFYLLLHEIQVNTHLNWIELNYLNEIECLLNLMSKLNNQEKS